MNNYSMCGGQLIPIGLFASSPWLYWTPDWATEFTVTVWRLGRLTWPVWPRGRLWTGAKVSCWACPCPWGNWRPWSDWTPWTYREREMGWVELKSSFTDKKQKTHCLNIAYTRLLWPTLLISNFPSRPGDVTWKVCHWICPVAVTVWAWMRKVPGLTSCTLWRVWPPAFRSWAWPSPDRCRIGCDIVVALEDDTCRPTTTKLHPKR